MATTLGTLISLVQDAVQDSSIAPSTIKRALNTGLLFVASKVLLPSLEASGTFKTSATVNSVSIPSTWNFGRNLYHASTNKVPIRIYPSMAHLTRKHNVSFDTVEQGDIAYLTVVQQKLVYFRSPAEATTVNCKFYTLPPPLEDMSDVPECIEKEEFQELLLLNYALGHAWSLKEDGMEGLKINTEYHQGVFKDALASYDSGITTGVSTPELDRSTSWI